MRPESFRAETLVKLLRRRTIATMEEMKTALGTQVDMTVFRKLRELAYLTSYSHRGQFYALQEVAEFDAQGLWSYRDARFSRAGSLINTTETFVLRAEAGVFAPELAAVLGVEVKEPLLKLVRADRIAREQLVGLYLYCSPEAATRRRQLLCRRAAVAEEPFGALPKTAAGPADEAKAAIILFLSILDEKQRRLFAGLESLRLGRGSDQRIADWTGLDVHTVARGRRELLVGDLRPGRVRRPGAGRRAVEKKRRK